MVTNKKKLALVLATLTAGALVSTESRAQDPPRPPEVAPRPPEPPPPAPEAQVHHAPPSVAKANEPLTIEIALDSPDKVKKATLIYRRGYDSEPFSAVPFERSSNAVKPYVAVIPGEHVRTPNVAYAIEIETTEGKQVPAFATRESMHSVALQENAGEARERALLSRFRGRRTTIATAGDYVDFGATPTVLAGQPRIQNDRYYRLEGQFTHRLFGVVSEFGFRGGIVRGSSPVPNADQEEQYDVGMNYGAPRIRFRAGDWFHIDVEGLTSVNEIGYSIGGGGAILLGDPYGTHLTFGFEGIRIFGMRGYTRLDVAVARWLTLGTLVEVTNMPHAESAGVRLVAEAKVDIGAGFSVGVRGGYQARAFASGGPAGGLTVGYSF